MGMAWWFVNVVLNVAAAGTTPGTKVIHHNRDFFSV